MNTNNQAIDSDLILSILEAAGIAKEDQFDALVAVEKMLRGEG